MGSLEGRVAVITGGGRGIGRAHALLFAREGAKVVVNDLGGPVDGNGSSATAAKAVVDEIKALGGEAIANTDSVSDWAGAERLVQTAIDAFGDLHCLINNAGILRGWSLLDIEEADWDAVIDVHLKGTFCVTRHAAAYWRQKAEADGPLQASVICTTSGAGLDNSGRSNYVAAKAGIAAFAQCVAKELAQYGVRVNSISPGARTRMTELTVASSRLKAPDDPNAFDKAHPSNVSPLVAYLSTADCPYTGGVWLATGGTVGLYEGWKVIQRAEQEERWTVEQLQKQVPLLVGDRSSRFSDRLISEGQSGPPWPRSQVPDD